MRSGASSLVWRRVTWVVEWLLRAPSLHCGKGILTSVALNLRAYAVPLDGNPHRLTVGTRPVPSGSGCFQEMMVRASSHASRSCWPHARRRYSGCLPGRRPPAERCSRSSAGELGQDTAGPQDVGPEEAGRRRSGAGGPVRPAAPNGRLGTDGGVRLFPFRWRLEAKLGAALGEIHAPVPGYQERLDAATNGVFERLAGDRAPSWAVSIGP